MNEETVQLAVTLSSGWPSAAAGPGVLITGLLRDMAARAARFDDDPWR